MTTTTGPLAIADWREGDLVTIEGVLKADFDGDLRVAGGTYLRVDGQRTGQYEHARVTVTRPLPSLPTKPGTVFRADMPERLETVVFEVGQSGAYRRPGWLTPVDPRWIDASTVEILWEPEP